MPGVNVPWSQVLYYLITLTISGVFHEFGHAISAVRWVLDNYFFIPRGDSKFDSKEF